MKTYLVRILCLAVFNALCELFLPAGNMRRFAASCIGISMTAAILLPAVALFRTDVTTLLPQIELATDANVYGNALLDGYKEKIEASIRERGDIKPEVIIGEDYAIRRIILDKTPDDAVMQYIVKDLGVAPRDVEIR